MPIDIILKDIYYCQASEDELGLIHQAGFPNYRNRVQYYVGDVAKAIALNLFS